MKYLSILACILAFAAPAYAQDVAAAEPEPELSDGGETAQEPEPELADGVEVAEPEPEVSEPEPELSDRADELGAAQPFNEDLETATVDEDLAAAVAEETGEAGDGAGDGAGEGNGEGSGRPLSAAERIGSVTGGQGLPWTFPITWTNNLSVRTLAPKAQLSHDPFFSMTFLAAPRWIFTPVISIGARQTLDIEFTDSNLTPEARDLEWGDLQLDTTFALPWTPGGFRFSPSIVARLPTSQLSRGQNRVLGPTARLLVMRPFSVAQGFIVGLSASYTYWINSEGRRRLREGTAGPNNNVVQTADGRTLPIRNAGSSNGCPTGTLDPSIDAAASAPTAACTGGNLVQHQTSLALFGSLLPVSGLSINASFAWIWLTNGSHDTTYLNNDQVITPDGQPLAVGDNSPTHTTLITSLSLGVGYDFTSYLTASFSYSTLSFYPDSDGSFENFFYNENSQFNLALQFRPSALVASRRAAASAEEAANQAAQRVAF